MADPRFTNDELITLSRQYYRDNGWVVLDRFGQEDEELATALPRRPELICKKSGMHHLIFVAGRLTDSAYKHQQQVLFTLNQKREHCHSVVVCEERTSKAREAQFKAAGVGLLEIRHGADALMLCAPRLQAFHPPENYDIVPRHARKKVREALRQVIHENVGNGILDLAQVLESELTRKGAAGITLGQKIRDAKNRHLIPDIAIRAATRVNIPRIRRAHPANHRQRRSAIVSRTQQIVGDCLAVLFALQ